MTFKDCCSKPACTCKNAIYTETLSKYGILIIVLYTGTGFLQVLDYQPTLSTVLMCCSEIVAHQHQLNLLFTVNHNL